jgi:hypothetical protein
MLIAACALTTALVGLTLCALPAKAHGDFKWVEDEQNPATKEGCCGESDCHAVERFSRHGESFVIYLGGIPLPFPVSQTRGSKDHHGRAVACLRPDGTVRCFFVPLGV